MFRHLGIIPDKIAKIRVTVQKSMEIGVITVVGLSTGQAGVHMLVAILIIDAHTVVSITMVETLVIRQTKRVREKFTTNQVRI